MTKALKVEQNQENNTGKEHIKNGSLELKTDKKKGSNVEETETMVNAARHKSFATKRKIIRSLSDDEYEAIFAAVLGEAISEEDGSDQNPDASQMNGKNTDVKDNLSVQSKSEQDGDEDSRYLKTMPESIKTEVTQSTCQNSKIFGNNLIGSLVPVSKYFSEKNSTKIVTEVKHLSTKNGVVTEKLEEEMGTWVQCTKRNCMKWRYLADIHDPAILPEVWTCAMNSDPLYNSCEASEQEYDEEDHSKHYVYTRYTAGSLVWAKMAGYPWWPGMLEVDPDYETYFECKGTSTVASQYHVVFFDKHVSRAWVSASNLMPFSGNEHNKELLMAKTKHGDFTKALQEARNEALEAASLPLRERLNLYSFSKRYKRRLCQGSKGVQAGNKNKERSRRTSCGSRSDHSGCSDFTESTTENIDVFNCQGEGLLNEAVLKEAEDTLNDILCNQKGSNKCPGKKTKMKRKSIMKGSEMAEDVGSKQANKDVNREKKWKTDVACKKRKFTGGKTMTDGYTKKPDFGNKKAKKAHEINKQPKETALTEKIAKETSDISCKKDDKNENKTNSFINEAAERMTDITVDGSPEMTKESTRLSVAKIEQSKTLQKTRKKTKKFTVPVRAMVADVVQEESCEKQKSAESQPLHLTPINKPIDTGQLENSLVSSQRSDSSHSQDFDLEM